MVASVDDERWPIGGLGQSRIVCRAAPAFGANGCGSQVVFPFPHSLRPPEATTEFPLFPSLFGKKWQLLRRARTPRSNTSSHDAGDFGRCCARAWTAGAHMAGAADRPSTTAKGFWRCFNGRGRSLRRPYCAARSLACLSCSRSTSRLALSIISRLRASPSSSAKADAASR